MPWIEKKNSKFLITSIEQPFYILIGNTLKRTNSERYWPSGKGDVKEYKHMSIRYGESDDQNLNPTNDIVKRILVVNNKNGRGTWYTILYRFSNRRLKKLGV